MELKLVESLRGRGVAIRATWETLLRIEPVSGPLANPEALKHLIPQSFDEIMDALARQKKAPSAAVARARLPACDCGNNPYRAYFIAAERALIEALVLLQAELPAAERRQSDLDSLIFVVRNLARREIDIFCGICAHRGSAMSCRHRAVCESAVA